jgi:formylglycine-generating enzyme required for sulfatase activity
MVNTKNVSKLAFVENQSIKISFSREQYYGDPSFSEYPVVAVTWFEANTYCGWVGGRLPTEAEWEKAARGTSIIAYPWGDQNPNCNLANSYNNASGDFCIGDTVKVGSYPGGASVYGVMDMAGNVWEWVYDWYSTDYYHKSSYADPTGDDTGIDKVIRGGGFDYSWSKLRIAYKSNHHPSTRHLSYGFRCVNPNQN